MKFLLEAPAGFCFAATVTSHGWYQLAPFVWSPEKEILERSELIGEHAIDLALASEGTAIAVTVAGRLAAGEVAILQERLARMFQFEVDLEDFHRLCSGSERHRWASDAGFGRLLCGSTFFEDVVKVIATTNTAWSQTKRMIELLVKTAAVGTSRGAQTFPSAVAVAAMDEEALRGCRFGYRAAYVREAAAMLCDGAFERELAEHAAEPPPDRLRRYRRIPGIGPYGAAHLMAMEGRHDFIAVDTEFRRFVREQYHNGRSVADATMLKRYSKWGRWQYLAYWTDLWGSR